MGSNQWLFWAAGVPLTVVIIIISLTWAGELGNAGTAFTGWFKKEGFGARGGNKPTNEWIGGSYGGEDSFTDAYLEPMPYSAPIVIEEDGRAGGFTKRRTGLQDVRETRGQVRMSELY
jgi:hypothetical protein